MLFWSKGNLPHLQAHHKSLSIRVFSGYEAPVWHLAAKIFRHKRSYLVPQSNLLTEPAEYSCPQHLFANHSQASIPLLPANGKGKKDICADVVSENLNPK